MPDKLTIDVYRDGWTGKLQLSISKTDEAGLGDGYRLAGPKFNGSGRVVLSRTLDERDAAEIRRYLDAVFPVAAMEADQLTAESYATSVVQVLRDHLPDFDPEAADIITEAVRINARRPQARFECIVDDPRRACWRLRARAIDHGRVRLAYYPVIPPGSESRREVERTVNEALRALGSSPLAAKEGR